ncbi:glycosyltransferase [Photobacterium damselae]|uniref:glycosyltransferase n=1 Tax=Photobacterium damselae TaxID=38293 RepID=UPI00165D9EA8|nr:glycosyltransferase [Photobacterium damselae]
MKILQVSKLYPPFFGGIETVVYDLVSELKKKDDCTVDVLCVSDKKKSTIELYEDVKVYRDGSSIHLSSVYLSFDFIKTWKKIRNSYDVVHIHLPNPLATFALFLFPTNAKVILHWHSDIIKQKLLKKLIWPIEKNALKISDSIIVTSENYLQHSNDLSDFKDKARVIPIGIKSNKYIKSDYLNILSEKYKSKKIVFSLGRHVYYKGFEYLIKAAEKLPDNYVVLIGGAGELTGQLESLIDELNLNSKVFLIGRIDDDKISDYFYLADVFCLPSIEKSEAFGVVQLEAMSVGLPIVSSDILGSGVGWVNKNGITGLTTIPKDIDDLSKKIRIVCENNMFNKDNVLEHFYSNFTREKMSESIIDLYRKLL